MNTLISGQGYSPSDSRPEKGEGHVSNSQGTEVRAVRVVVSPGHEEARLVSGCIIALGEVMITVEKTDDNQTRS